MDTWIDLTNELMKDEIVQLELLCREVIESLPFVVVCAIPILFGTAWLLAALDGMFVQNQDMPQSLDQHQTADQHLGSPRDKLSQPTTRLLQTEANAAA